MALGGLIVAISFGLVHRVLSKLPPSFKFHVLFLKLRTHRVGEQPHYSEFNTNFFFVKRITSAESFLMSLFVI